MKNFSLLIFFIPSEWLNFTEVKSLLLVYLL